MEVGNPFLVGINHSGAPVASRERLVVHQEELAGALRHLMLPSRARLREVVVLSTCSRTEATAVAEDAEAALSRVYEWLLSKAGRTMEAGIYVLSGGDAVRHLFRVAAGLDSWILGESEILVQMKRAHQTALELGTAGDLLNQMFQRAISAGRSVRVHTGLQDGVHSIGGAAVVLIRRIFSREPKGRVLVFGAGETARAVARHLAAENFKDLCVANRTWERARVLAEGLEAGAVTLEQGFSQLAEARAAIFAASTPKAILKAETLRALLAGRRDALCLIDLGMPRNIDPDCGRLEGVYLYDLDDVRALARQGMMSKAEAKRSAEALVAAEAGACASRLDRSAERRTEEKTVGGEHGQWS